MEQEESANDVLQLVKGLRDRKLNNLARYIYRTALREAIRTNYSIAEEFAKEPNNRGFLDYNLPFLAVPLADNNRSELAIKLLQCLGAFSNPDNIATVLLLAELKGEKECEYMSRNIVIPEGFQLGSGQEDVIKWLRKNTSEYFLDDNIQTLLCFAAENGQETIVENIIKEYPEINCETALSYALSSGQTKIVELLIENGIDPEEPIRWPPLPVYNTRLRDTGEKAKQNTVVNREEGGTRKGRDLSREFLPLGNVEATKPLVSDIQCEEAYWNITPLEYASVTAQLGLVQTLLLKGLDPNKTHGSCKEMTPLGLAHHQGLFDCVSLLLKAPGITIGPCNGFGMTPLHIAAAIHDESAVRLLLDRGADIDLSDALGLTPLMHCAYTSHPDISTLHMLLNRGADINKADCDGRTSLGWAGNTEVMRTLLTNPWTSRKILYAVDNDGYIPLTLQAGKPKALQLLVPHYTKEFKTTLTEAFWEAVRACNPGGAMFLIDYIDANGIELHIQKMSEWKQFTTQALTSLEYLVRYKDDSQWPPRQRVQEVSGIVRKAQPYLKDYFVKLTMGKPPDKAELESITAQYTAQFPHEEDYIREVGNIVHDYQVLALRMTGPNYASTKTTKNISQPENETWQKYSYFYKAGALFLLLSYYCPSIAMKVFAIYEVLSVLAHIGLR
ncbi:hypothetical protein E8E15_001359 [Penicillium rubens]|nr:hypothetical protein E8E15_001359 [Penicillium rubens]